MTDPLMLSPATRILGKLKSQQGTLVLLPDRLAFVESKARTAGAAFGVIGMLLAQRSAKNKAPGRALEGGDGVTTVLLSDLKAISRTQQGLNKNVLLVTGPAGDEKLGVKYDKWAPAITAAAEAAGRRATTTEDGAQFA